MADVAFFNNSRNADSYLWDFGDGSTSTAASPTHTFAFPGAYVVRLTAARGGVTARTQRVVTVRGGVAANFLVTTARETLTTNSGDQITVT